MTIFKNQSRQYYNRKDVLILISNLKLIELKDILTESKGMTENELLEKLEKESKGLKNMFIRWTSEEILEAMKIALEYTTYTRSKFEMVNNLARIKIMNQAQEDIRSALIESVNSNTRKINADVDDIWWHLKELLPLKGLYKQGFLN